MSSLNCLSRVVWGSSPLMTERRPTSICDSHLEGYVPRRVRLGISHPDLLSVVVSPVTGRLQTVVYCPPVGSFLLRSVVTLEGSRTFSPLVGGPRRWGLDPRRGRGVRGTLEVVSRQGLLRTRTKCLSSRFDVLGVFCDYFRRILLSSDRSPSPRPIPRTGPLSGVVSSVGHPTGTPDRELLPC